MRAAFHIHFKLERSEQLEMRLINSFIEGKVYLSIIHIFSYFYELKRINFYFIEYLRMAMIFYSLVFVALSYTVINNFYSLNTLLKTLIFIVIAFNFIRLIIIYFKFQRNMSIKNLHLFSYLCSTELIPMIIGLNFFVK